ncbi:MAG: hypothetical protein IJ710_02495 [Prevotella sp.]|nr:hypothetical protein [Prevotella sp.]
MKKTKLYQAPKVEIFKIETNNSLLAGSLKVDGGDTGISGGGGSGSGGRAPRRSDILDDDM